MKRKEMEKIKVIGITALVVIVVGIILIGIGGHARQTGDNGLAQNSQQVPVSVTVKQASGSTGNGGTNTALGGSCQQNSVYFIHADWCPHCQKMAPWVADLGTQGYAFVSVTTENLASYKDCLTGVAKMQYIPEFVCLSNKQSHVGGFTDENAMKEFADACGAGPQ
jgi:thiol-disulfide isomerase/thioredoxin